MYYCTAILQPMDQNVINLTKMFYKKGLLTHLVGSQGADLETKIKSFNLRHAICLLATAWERVKSSAIRKCWNLLMCPDNEFDEEDSLPLQAIRDRIMSDREALTSINNLLQELTSTETFDTEELNNWISENNVESAHAFTHLTDEEIEIEEEYPSVSPQRQKVKNEHAIQAFGVCLQWAEDNSVSVKDMLTLQKLRELAIDWNLSSKKIQTNISQYFKKI